MNQNNQSHEDSLLAGVLAEASAEFRETMLAETLRLARQRRRRRPARTAGGILVIAVLLATLAWRIRLPGNREHSPATMPNPPRDYQLVLTRPLPSDAIVTTEQYSLVKIISSNSSPAPIATTAGNYRSINDDELLALVADEPAVLVRTGPNSETLVFASAEKQNLSFGN